MEIAAEGAEGPDRPVIAVPTSVGYGAAFQGLAALLGMMNSCASNVSVVNIDNGFGAGDVAALVAPLMSGHSDLSIGSRLARGSRVVRGARREVISRCYNLVLKGALGAGFTDADGNDVAPGEEGEIVARAAPESVPSAFPESGS